MGANNRAIQSLPEVYQGLGPFPFFEAPSTFQKMKKYRQNLFYCSSKIPLFFFPQICGNPVWSKPIGSIFPTASSHFMSVSHFGYLGKHYYHYICYCDLRSCFCGQKLLPTISVNDECFGHPIGAISHCSSPLAVHPEGNAGWKRTEYWC